MNRIANRAMILLIFIFVLLGGFGFFIFEYVTQSSGWLISESSPHFDTRGNLKEGIVQDCQDKLIMDLSGDRIFSENPAFRKTFMHWLGGRDGNIVAPLLSNFKQQMLKFDLATGTYVYGENVPHIKLTLSAQVQQAALEAMGNYKGTVAVYNYQTGQLLCAVTTPTFDPDNKPANLENDPLYKDAYFNKFTQFTYTPGSIFKIVTLAAAVEELEDLQSLEFTCTGSYLMGVDTVTCTGTHGKQNIQQAFRNSCNCAFAQLSEHLGTDALASYVEQFGITNSVSLDGIETKAGNFEKDPSAVNVAWSSIGQFTDLINPCAYLQFVGNIAAGGSGARMYVMERITVDNVVTYEAERQAHPVIMSQETAQLVSQYMRSNVADKYGDWNFPGMTVCAKTGTGEVGGGKKPNAMLTGFVTDEQYPIAFIVCVEDAGFGGTVCMPIASKVLASCKEVLDS